jgi:hypothetical protein
LRRRRYRSAIAFDFFFTIIFVPDAEAVDPENTGGRGQVALPSSHSRRGFGSGSASDRTEADQFSSGGAACDFGFTADFLGNFDCICRCAVFGPA